MKNLSFIMSLYRLLMIKLADNRISTFKKGLEFLINPFVTKNLTPIEFFKNKPKQLMLVDLISLTFTLTVLPLFATSLVFFYFNITTLWSDEDKSAIVCQGTGKTVRYS